MPEQTIIRVVHTSNYFSMARSSAQDSNLSWEARGMLAYFLSKPDDWQVRVADLQQKCGRDKAKAILVELEEARYIRVERGQHNPETGEFATNIYFVYETPFTENPLTVEPLTVNPPLTYNREEQSTENRDNNLSSLENATGDNSPFEAKTHGASNGNEISKTHNPNPPSKVAPKVSPAKPPRPRDPIFDAVAAHVFGITDDAELKAMNDSEDVSPRIGGIASWLKGTTDKVAYGKAKKTVGFISAPAKPEHVKAFAAWYAQKNPTANMVTDGEKFVTYWRKWASSMKAKQQPRPTQRTAALPELTPEQRQQRQAELAAQRNQMGAR